MKPINQNKANPAKRPSFKVECVKTMVAIGLFLLLLLALGFPLLTIWSLNTLFGLQIAYTFKSWLATVILIITLQAAINIKREKRININ